MNKDASVVTCTRSHTRVVVVIIRYLPLKLNIKNPNMTYGSCIFEKVNILKKDHDFIYGKKHRLWQRSLMI